MFLKKNEYIIETSKRVNHTIYDPYTNDHWKESNVEYKTIYKAHSKLLALWKLNQCHKNGMNCTLIKI